MFMANEQHKVTAFSIEKGETSLSSYLKETCPHNYSLHVDTSAVQQLPFNNSEFDCVFSIGVLEHVRETGGSEIASLQELNRILKPLGLFICYHLPNKYSWIEALSYYIPGKYSHPYRYRKHDIELMLDRSGFEILEIGRYGILPRLMFRKFPDILPFVHFFNAADNLIGRFLNPFCQNYYFVARKISV